MKGMSRNLNVNEIASLGSNVKPVIQNENCSILMLNDAIQPEQGNRPCRLRRDGEAGS